MLALRDYTEEIAAFEACYAIRSNGFAARFEQVQQPVLSGSLDQPAKLMDALQWMAAVANDELRKREEAQKRV